MTAAATIKAEHVALAAVTHKMRTRLGCKVARFAAMSGATSACGPTCGSSRSYRDWSQRQRQARTPLFLAMNHGDLVSAVERTRLCHGLKEVRATWGCGLKALRAEIATAGLA
ncbi:hypothetical protein [Caldimonas sp. KR1-144]|uniref:hypothetical protein n=1 Tax=Caldimonas sp. KR1-144 TaxID=3400911 RepID=UPI003BFEA18B